ncbi:MAG TPA: glycosyltransferase [Vicinamibacterales bacterium]
MRGIVAAMRVARIITRLNVGGPSIHVANLASGLTAYGVETLLVYGAISPAEGDMSYVLDQLRPLAGAKPGACAMSVPTLHRQVDPVNDARAGWRIYRALCQFKPDIVHTHTAKAGALGRAAALAYNRTAGRQKPARIVHTYHGHVLDGYFGPAKTAAFVGAEKRLASATDRLIAVSPIVRDELLSRYQIGRQDQYRVVPLGFELDVFAGIDDGARVRARETLLIPATSKVVTTVGRLTAIKDHVLFLESAAAIARQHPGTIFLVAGDGELRAELEARAATLGIREQVRFLGWRRDLEVLYGATDVFLLTSRNEGTPVALIESLAAGCAAVATDVGGVRDVVSSTQVGLLAPAGDGVSLARHVNTLLGDHDARRAMGEAGRRMVLPRYGVARLVTDIDRLYRELVG